MNLYSGETGILGPVPDVCPEESCYASCDESCPRFPDRICDGLLARGEAEAALHVAREAIADNPYLTAAWMRLGRVCEQLGCMAEAYNAYYVACGVNRKTDTEISHAFCRTLIALHWWDLAEQEEEKTDEMIAAIAAGRQSGAEPLWPAHMILPVLVDMAGEDGLLAPEHYTLRPDIMGDADDICRRLHRELVDYDERTGVTIGAKIQLAWAAYAGIGAEWHFCHDELALREKGIAAALLEPRGIFAMDEAVLDLIGLPFGSPEGKDFEKRLRYSLCCDVAQGLDERATPPSEDDLIEHMKACYFLGIAIEKQRLTPPA